MKRIHKIIYFSSVFVILLLFGWMFDFELTKVIDINFHDLYLVSSAWQIILFTMLFFGYLYFLFLSFGTKFRAKPNVWILLIHNSLVIFLVIVTFYLIYQFMLTEALILTFSETSRADLSIFNLRKISVIYGIQVILFGSIEFYLIRRLFRLSSSQRSK